MIEISTTVQAPLSEIWDKWNNIDDLHHWSFASDEWGAEGIENDLTLGGTFKARNFAKDGSAEFMLEWTYDRVEPGRLLAYTMGDGRKVIVTFTDLEGSVRIDQAFDPESENPEELQRAGWQAYLDNFKKFVEKTE